MFSNKHMRLSFILLIPAALALFTLLSQAEDTKEASSSLTRVDPEYVCMINDQLFGNRQIPVQVEGKTYYGCCKMCEVTLKRDPNSRTAVDPVSGEKVDKALSVIGAAESGKVYYFENVENLEKFNRSAEKRD